MVTKEKIFKARISDLGPKWVRLSPNGTNFKDLFVYLSSEYFKKSQIYPTCCQSDTLTLRFPHERKLYQFDL